ncbi:sensor histidine kinase [Fibrobacterota bacterium]
MKFARIAIPILLLYAGTLFLAFQYYQHSSRAVDRELQARISTTARAVQTILESSPHAGQLFDLGNDDITDALSEIEEAFALENIHILDMLSQITSTTNPFLDLDERVHAELSEEEKSSLSGGDVYIRPLVNLEGSQFKTVMVPVTGGLERGTVMMDINLSYLDSLKKMKTRYMSGVIISTLLFFGVLLFSFSILQKLDRSRAEKEQNDKFTLMGRMSATMAHEIKNPLGIIKSSAQLIEKKYGKKNDEIFSYIYEEIDKLNLIINDYLTFSKDITVHPESIDLETHIKHILKDFPGVEFNSSGKGNVSYDPLRFTQLLRNLLLNARKHGGGNIRVITVNREHEVCMQVCDEGPGIPDNRLETIFQPFTTTSKTGTGLGLSICRKIAELHGGSIRAEKVKPQGARFTVTMPGNRPD